MNTRQKLTLGIAAIFMVTLTIIGVTYAYFVTTITAADGAADETIIVTETARIGATYSAGDQTVTLENVLPGDVVYKAWAVNNTGDAAASVALNLTTKVPEDATVEFAHTGTIYDNIKVSLVQVDATTAVDTTTFFAKEQADLKTMYDAATTIQTAVNAPYTGTTINLGDELQPVAKGGYNYYILKVEYVDTLTNQNVENNAGVSVIPSISATMEA